jgi:hypothetical protein
MPSSRPTDSRGSYNHIRDLKWSAAEKVIARKAFDLALGREFQIIIQEVKGKAARIKQPSELWDLERYLTQRRQEIDRQYDYRYSVLPLVFGSLLSTGRLSEKDLHGLGEDKLALIRNAALLA